MNNQEVKFQPIFGEGEEEKGTKQSPTLSGKEKKQKKKCHKQKAEESRQHHI